MLGGIPDNIIGLNSEITGRYQVLFQRGAYAAAFAMHDMSAVGIHIEEVLGP